MGKSDGRQDSKHDYFQCSLREIPGPNPAEVLKLPETLTLHMQRNTTRRGKKKKKKKAVSHINNFALTRWTIFLISSSIFKHEK